MSILIGVILIYSSLITKYDNNTTVALSDRLYYSIYDWWSTIVYSIIMIDNIQEWSYTCVHTTQHLYTQYMWYILVD